MAQRAVTLCRIWFPRTRGDSGRAGLFPAQAVAVVAEPLGSDGEGKAAVGLGRGYGAVRRLAAQQVVGDGHTLDTLPGAERAGRRRVELHLDALITQASADALLVGAEQHVAVVKEEGLVPADDSVGGGQAVGQFTPP